jgi:hypothetical protein
VGTLDGGRVLGAISPAFGVLGLGAGAGLVASGSVSNPLFYLIMLGGAYHTVSRFAGWSESELPPHYYDLDRATQTKIFAAYLALVGALLLAMQHNNSRRKSPKQLQTESRVGEWGDEGEWVRDGSGIDQIEDWKRRYGFEETEDESESGWGRERH